MKRGVRPIDGIVLFILAAVAPGPAAGGNDANIADPLAPPVSVSPRPEENPPGRFTGTVMSAAGATAIVGGHLLRVGDRIGNARVTSIGPRFLELMIGDRLRNLRLGESLGGSGPIERQASVTIRRSVKQREAALSKARRSPDTAIATDQRTPPQRPDNRRVADTRCEPCHRGASYTVKFGETLSGIALRYRNGAISHEELMNKIYAANPQAFGGDMDRLRAGAVIRLPPGAAPDESRPGHTAEMLATREAHLKSPKISKNVFKSADLLEKRQVLPGDTLSKVALEIRDAGLTLNQVMIALYDANRSAFDDNINALRAGAVLRLPPRSKLAEYSPERAATIVEQHAAAWRSSLNDRETQRYFVSAQ